MLHNMHKTLAQIAKMKRITRKKVVRFLFLVQN